MILLYWNYYCILNNYNTLNIIYIYTRYIDANKPRPIRGHTITRYILNTIFNLD